jgi:hypothetical protein
MEEKIYEITEETLKFINDDDLEYALIEFILQKKIANNYEQKYEIVTKLPKGLMYHYVSWFLEAEVYNGGFNQYFYNTSAAFINEAIDAYKYFGLHEISCIVDDAAMIAIQEIDLHIETKKAGTIEAFSKSYLLTNLGEADSKFYEKCGVISEARVKHIRNNIDDFLCK